MDIPTWVCYPLPNGSRDLMEATALVPIYVGDRQILGQLNIRIPDKRISRRMFEYKCDENGRLEITVCGLNIAYFAASISAPQEALERGKVFSVTDENCVFMLPGGVHTLVFRRYSFWTTEDAEGSANLLKRFPFMRRSGAGPPGPGTAFSTSSGSLIAGQVITQASKSGETASRQARGLATPPKDRPTRDSSKRGGDRGKGSQSGPREFHKIKVYLEDSVVLRQLGLNNTFRTLILFPETDARELHEQMIQKMCKAMTQSQKDAIFKETEDYRLYEVKSSSKDKLRMLEFNETPFRKINDMVFKLPSYARSVSPLPKKGSTKANVQPITALGRRKMRGFSSEDLTSEAKAAMQEVVPQPPVASTSGRTVIKAFVRDSVIFRQLGLHNTFKTLMLEPTTTLHDMNRIMVKKMCKAMKATQVELLTRECENYTMFETTEEGDRRIGENEFPASLVPTRFSFLPSGSPSIDNTPAKSASRSPSPTHMRGIQTKVMIAESIILTQLNLSSTYRTIELFPTTTATAIRNELLKKMVHGLTSSQAQVVQKECSNYWIYERIDGQSGMRALEAEERPQGKLVGELCFRPRVLLAKRTSSSFGRKNMISPKQNQAEKDETSASSIEGEEPGKLLSRLSLKPQHIEQLCKIALGPPPPLPADVEASMASQYDTSTTKEGTKSASTSESKPSGTLRHVAVSLGPPPTPVIAQDSTADSSTGISKANSFGKSTSTSSNQKARIIVQICDTWKLKVPFPLNGTMGDLTHEIQSRLLKRSDRVQSACNKSEADISEISLVADDKSEFDVSDILSDVWSEGDVLCVRWE